MIYYFIQNKHRQAEIRARLAKAKSIREALIILKSSGKKGRMGMYHINEIVYLNRIFFFILIRNNFS